MRASDGTGQRGHPTPQHVWVKVTGDPAYRHPGVVLDWRRTGTRWAALVVYVEGGGNLRPRAHCEWLRREHVEPTH